MNVVENSYLELKHYFDNVLNNDRGHFKTSNDEPIPISCIEDMLSVVPDDVWYRRNLKVLDPCCGNGNFHLVIYSLLLALGLDPKDILENMLYFNDANTSRLLHVKQVFAENDYMLNITTNDFLTTCYTEKFDVIVANPPYAKLMENGKRASKNHNLIQLFLEKSLST